MERVDQSPQITINVPRGWGNNDYLDLDPFSLLMLIGNREATNAAEKRYKVNQKTRERMKELGFKIREVDEMPNVLEEREFNIIGRCENIKKELSFVRDKLGIRVPKSLTARKFIDYPFFPVVAVNHKFNCGEGKYLIEGTRQWNILKKFFCENKTELSSYLMKEFIETPSDRYTSYRILTSATGNIMAAGLIYSPNKKSENIIAQRDAKKEYIPHYIHMLLELKKNPYFLKAKKITSNASKGGTIIPLNPTKRSREITEQERELLEVHGITNGKLPKELAKNAKAIATTLGKCMGLYMGIDFIQDKSGNFYYLETNISPGLKTYLAAKNKGVGEESRGYEMVMKEATRLLQLAACR